MWIKLIKKSELQTGQLKRVVHGNKPVGLYLNEQGKILAFSDVCTHEDMTLTEGRVIDNIVVECPAHGARFSMVTGKVLSGPTTENINVYETKVEGEDIFVKLESSSDFIPGLDDIGYDIEDFVKKDCVCGGKCDKHE